MIGIGNNNIAIFKKVLAREKARADAGGDAGGDAEETPRDANSAPSADGLTAQVTAHGNPARADAARDDAANDSSAQGAAARVSVAQDSTAHSNAARDPTAQVPVAHDDTAQNTTTRVTLAPGGLRTAKSSTSPVTAAHPTLPNTARTDETSHLQDPLSNVKAARPTTTHDTTAPKEAARSHLNAAPTLRNTTALKTANTNGASAQETAAHKELARPDVTHEIAAHKEAARQPVTHQTTTNVATPHNNTPLEIAVRGTTAQQTANSEQHAYSNQFLQALRRRVDDAFPNTDSTIKSASQSELLARTKSSIQSLLGEDRSVGRSGPVEQAVDQINELQREDVFDDPRDIMRTLSTIEHELPDAIRSSLHASNAGTSPVVEQKLPELTQLIRKSTIALEDNTKVLQQHAAEKRAASKSRQRLSDDLQALRTAMTDNDETGSLFDHHESAGNATPVDYPDLPRTPPRSDRKSSAKDKAAAPEHLKNNPPSTPLANTKPLQRHAAEIGAASTTRQPLSDDLQALKRAMADDDDGLFDRDEAAGNKTPIEYPHLPRVPSQSDMTPGNRLAKGEAEAAETPIPSPLSDAVSTALPQHLKNDLPSARCQFTTNESFVSQPTRSIIKDDNLPQSLDPEPRASAPLPSAISMDMPEELKNGMTSPRHHVDHYRHKNEISLQSLATDHRASSSLSSAVSMDMPEALKNDMASSRLHGNPRVSSPLSSAVSMDMPEGLKNMASTQPSKPLLASSAHITNQPGYSRQTGHMHGSAMPAGMQLRPSAGWDRKSKTMQDASPEASEDQDESSTDTNQNSDTDSSWSQDPAVARWAAKQNAKTKAHRLF